MQYTVYAVIPTSDSEGFISSGFALHNTFNNSNMMLVVNPVEAGFGSGGAYFTMGIPLCFGLKKVFFDFMYEIGLKGYLVDDCWSLSAKFGISPMVTILDSFTYRAGIGTEINIPLVDSHYLSIGAGIYYRDHVPMLGYMGLPENYMESAVTYYFKLSWFFQ